MTTTQRYLPAIFLLLTLMGFLIVHPVPASAETFAEQRARLEKELAEIEADILSKRGVLKEKQAARTNVERDIGVLNAKIETAQLSIKYRDTNIKKLRTDITEKSQAIGEVNEKITRAQATLGELLRRTNEIDDISLFEFLLAGDISDVFEDIDQFQTIERELDTAFDQMELLKEDLSERKRSLEERQGEEEDLRRIQVLEKQSVERNKVEKDQILKVTKGEEKAYQQLIATREKSAAEIRTALFSLRDGAAIKFGDAYRFAKEASAVTGVRAAVILGIIAEESNLGENVGTGTWKVDMHPDRDRPLFAEITRHLGLDPDAMKVSKKPWYGWGGAMGPAQFIPSTWVLYAGYECTKTAPMVCAYIASKDRIGKMTGTQPPNPWDARTAIYAAALLMADNGADKGTRESERLAALRYFAGWKNATKTSYAFYGNEVMDLADKFQKQADILER
ncbi:MAG: hypothetical protein AAB421_05575 [Patescibacteria group bacterium]